MGILKVISVALQVLALSSSVGAAAERHSALRPQSPRPAPAVQVTENRGVKIARITRDAWIGPMWQPDDSWDELVIDAHVTLTGNVLVPATRKKPLVIRGKDRFTSRIVGTNTQEWLRTENDLARRHSAIFVDTMAPVRITNLTSRNPDKYHFVGYNHTQLHVDHVDILDDRLAYTTDGVAGGKGTTVSDAYIDTYDDAIKIYAPDMVIENVTIVHNRNGAPLQFGWSDEEGSATIRNLTIIANEPEIYNQGIFGRAAQIGHTNPQAASVMIDGLHVIVPEGRKRPPLFMWGTPDGQIVNNFTLTVTGLCSGTAAAYRDRSTLDIVPRGSEKGVTLITPDCR